jgi:hypothetical protein
MVRSSLIQWWKLVHGANSTRYGTIYPGTFVLFVILKKKTVMTDLSLNSRYLGIQQIVFGGRCMGDWEEGMTNPEYGYKYFKI